MQLHCILPWFCQLSLLIRIPSYILPCFSHPLAYMQPGQLLALYTDKNCAEKNKWQYQVEIEHYSFANFDHITTFEGL